MEDVNNLLNTGEIPNLFPAEDHIRWVGTGFWMSSDRSKGRVMGVKTTSDEDWQGQ